MVKPYSDNFVNNNEWVRTFSHELESDELVWHRDNSKREITVLEGKDWLFQYDNKLPFIMIENEKYIIEKMCFHRIIKGSTDLKIRIKEIT